MKTIRHSVWIALRPTWRLRTMLLAMTLLTMPLVWLGSVIRNYNDEQALVRMLNRDASNVDLLKLLPRWQRKAHIDNWLVALGLNSRYFKRVASLQCWAPGSCVPSLARLGTFHELTRLHLTGVSLRQDDAVAIAQLPHLEELVVMDLHWLFTEDDVGDAEDDDRVGDDEDEYRAAHNDPNNIKYIEYIDAQYIMHEYQLDIFAVPNTLCEVFEPTVARRAWEAQTALDESVVGPLTFSPELKRLTLPIKRLDGRTARALERLQGLEQLCLPSCSVSDEACASLSKLVALERLYISDCQISDAGLKHLGNLRRLRRLFLGGCAVSDAGIKALRSLSELKELQLSSPLITDNGLRQLSRLPLADSLTTLDVSRCSLGDNGMTAILNFKALHSLNLNGTDVGDGGLLVLAQSRTLERGEVRLRTRGHSQMRLWMQYKQGYSAPRLSGALESE